MADILKGAYYALEDRYYALLDRVQKAIPIYSIVDPIDKVIPSFVLILIVIILAIGAVGAVLLGGGGIPFLNASTLNFSVTDKENAPIQGAQITLSYGEETKSITSDEYGAASISVPLNTEISFEVSHEGHSTFSDSFTANAGTIPKEIVLEEEAVENLARTINLKNEQGQPLPEAVSLSFVCTNPQAVAPDSQLTSDGFAVVQVPKNCGTLKATAKARGFEDKQAVLASASNTVYMKESTASFEAKGTIIANVDFNGIGLDGIRVQVLNEQLTEAIDSKATSGGQAKFELDAGNYYVFAQANQRFGEQKTDGISLQAGQTKPAYLHMEESIKGNILVQVLDKDTELPVDKAKVTLKFGETTIAGPLDTNRDLNSMLSFPVSMSAKYTIAVDHPDYLIEQQADAEYGSTLHQVKLERYVQGVNGGILKVRVFDQDSKPVPNARVALFDAQLSQNTGFGEQTTDMNGVAKFNRVINGDYYAFAYKGSASGKSDPLPHFDSRSPEVTLTVTVSIPSASIRTNVTDFEGKPFPYALVAVYDYLDNTKLASDYTDENGAFKAESKADKRVYVVVNDPKGKHADYVSGQKDLLPNTETAFNVQLMLPSKSLGLDFVGLYKDGLKASSNAEAGQEYIAKFVLKIPSASDNALVHIRTGNKDIVENDSWFIKSVAIPRASVLAGSSYSPNDPSGYNKDAGSDTSNGMKWFNASWTGLKAGNYEVEARLKVKETATLGEPLNLEYRAWSETGETKTYYPSQVTSAQYDLYSSTKQELFSVGPSTFCTVDFCFDATIMDLKQNLSRSVTNSYSARISQDYRLTFTLTNNSSRIHNNSEIRIENPEQGITFKSYSINTASGQQFVNEAWNRNYVGYNQDEGQPQIGLGNFGPNNKVQGKITFSPKQAITSSIVIKIVSDYQVVFEKEISVTTAAAKNFSISFNPTVLPSGTQNLLSFQVKDSSVQPEVEVQGVWARVMDHRKGNPILSPAQTNFDGNVQFNIPGQMPGERLFVEFQKADFAMETIEVPVESGVFQFSPASLSVTMNSQTKKQSIDSFTVQNKTNFELQVTALKLQGNSKGLINLTSTNNFFKSMVGVKIQPGGQIEFGENNFLTEEGGALMESQTLDMETVLTVSAKGQTWQEALPTSVSIGVGKEVESADCLAVSLKSWHSSTEGNPVQAEFTIQNNCVVDGMPVDLRGLEAKLELGNSNLLGSYVLNISDSDLLGHQELRPGYFKKILNVFEKEKSYTAVLLFTPNGGVNGTDASTIIFRATNPISGSKQFLTSKISAAIGIINLKDCISISKDIVQLSEEKQDTFNISAKGCAGTVDVKFDSELELNKNDFTLQATETSPEIAITTKKIIPGAYLIDAKVKGEGQQNYKTIRTILVRVMPPAGTCIDMDKFEFDIYNNPKDPNSGFDTATITNNCYERRQAITFEKPPLRVNTFFSNWEKALMYGVFGLLATLPGYAKNKIGGGGICEGDYCPLDPALFGTEGSGSRNVVNWTPAGKVVLVTAGKAQAPTTAYATATGLFGLAEILPLLSSVTSMHPFLGFGAGFMISLIVSWVNREETTIDAVVVDVDDTSYTLMLPKTLTDTPSKDINLSVIGNKKTFGIMPNNGLENSSVSLAFQSITSTPSGKFARILTVKGVRNVYSKKYPSTRLERVGEITGPLTAENMSTDKKGNDAQYTDFTQKFHLVFKNINPTEEATGYIPPYMLNCQLGTKSGTTGPNALPKIGLAQGKDWSWNEAAEGISFNSCDENTNYIYCDSTQFSIEVLKKLSLINKFLTDNPSLNCPDLSQIAGTSASKSIGANDIGLERAFSQYLGGDLKITVETKNTNPGTSSGTIKATLKNLDDNSSKQASKPVSLAAGQASSTEFTFTAPVKGNYKVDANLVSVSVSCQGCLNAPETDYLNIPLVIVGSAGLEQCDPKTTDPGAQISLKDFIAATENARHASLTYPAGIKNADEFQKLISFKAYLIQDGYSWEFQRDFDDYAMTKEFFGADSEYKDKFHNYFKDTSRLSFKPRYELVPGEPFKLSEPGMYQVDFNITFGSEWKMFDGAPNYNPKAKIIITMEKVSSPSPPSPWYYLPFDGMIGTENGRINYGLDYIGEPIQLTPSLRAIEIKGSNSEKMQTSVYNDFKSLNVSNRGVLLSVQNTDLGSAMVFSPSLATPVIMQITNKGGKEAWGFYSVGVDQNSASNVGQTMNYWYGIGLNCKDFEENSLTQAYQWTPDMHGLNTKCARLGGIDNSAYAYGFEWCDSTQTGNVYLKSVFFTPPGKESVIFRSGANEEMKFITSSSLVAERVGLDGSVQARIGSVKEVFDQVRGNNICVSGTGVKQEFWWNPKAVLDKLADREKEVEQTCIKAS